MKFFDTFAGIGDSHLKVMPVNTTDDFMKESTRMKMSISAKKRCTKEWREEISKKLSTKLPKKQIKELYSSGWTQTEIAKKYNVSQKVIWGFMKRNGIKARIAKKRNQIGKRNHMWKGENATYNAFHKRLATIYGKPKKCEVCGTTDKTKTYNWANLTGEYDNPKDYKRMCRSCHSKHDKIVNNFKGGNGNEIL